jgi:hypothetical protein
VWATTADSLHGWQSYAHTSDTSQILPRSWGLAVQELLLAAITSERHSVAQSDCAASRQPRLAKLHVATAARGGREAQGIKRT